MKEIKKYLKILTGLLGFLMAAATVLVILIQYRYEIEPILIAFCALSWILFSYAAYETSRLKD